MKITTFNSQIFTKNADPIVDLFEGLGFQKRHDQEGLGELNVEGIRMKNEDGFIWIFLARIPTFRAIW